jgi:hypothetical protein
VPQRIGRLLLHRLSLQSRRRRAPRWLSTGIPDSRQIGVAGPSHHEPVEFFGRRHPVERLGDESRRSWRDRPPGERGAYGRRAEPCLPGEVDDAPAPAGHLLLEPSPVDSHTHLGASADMECTHRPPSRLPARVARRLDVAVCDCPSDATDSTAGRRSTATTGQALSVPRSCRIERTPRRAERHHRHKLVTPMAGSTRGKPLPPLSLSEPVGCRL